MLQTQEAGFGDEDKSTGHVFGRGDLRERQHSDNSVASFVIIAY